MLKDKLSSRKFIAFITAALCSLGTNLVGLFSGQTEYVLCGVICLAVSAGLYAIAEGNVDSSRMSANTKTTKIEASTTSANVVTDMLSNNEKQ